MTKHARLRTPENADRICELLAEGRTLRQVARELGCDYSAILHWVREDQDAGGAFTHRYARAMELRCERMAEEILEIADDNYPGRDGYADNALVQQARLRVDSRKWLLSKMLPKKYGDRVTAELTSDPNAPVVTRIELVPVDPKPRREDLPSAGDEVTVTPLRVLPSR